MLCLHACLCISFMPSALERQERAMDSLKLECRWLQTAMWVLGIKPRSLEKQHILLTTKPPLQPKMYIIDYTYIHKYT